MSADSLRKHSNALLGFAAQSASDAAAEPNDWLLSIVAKNQRDNADYALRSAEVEEALSRGELLEFRFQGQRLKNGALPLEFLSKLAPALNSLLVKAAYFARNKIDAMYGAADDLSREIDLSLVDVAPGSTRMFIRGNVLPDMTGSQALSEGIENIFALLSATGDSSMFYEQIDDVGERAAVALRDTLKAIESEECSVEVQWHSQLSERRVMATFDRVVQMRTLLDGVESARKVSEQVSGYVTLLSVTGRLQLQTDDGQRLTIRFRPRSQGQLVSRLTLSSRVTVDVVTKIWPNPITGEDVKSYSLTSLDAPTLLS